MNVYWIISGIVIFVFIIWVLYIIGKNVKKEEARIKKQFVDAKKENKYKKYSRKSTPKVPAINGRRKNTSST